MDEWEEKWKDLEKKTAEASESSERKNTLVYQQLDESKKRQCAWERKTESFQGILIDGITPIYNNVLVWLST